MTVDVEMPPPPPPPELSLLEVCVGAGVVDVCVSETTTTLVTTWPPAFVVTMAEVTGLAAAVVLAAALVGVAAGWAFACVDDFCAAATGDVVGVVACCEVGEAAGVVVVAACGDVESGEVDAAATGAGAAAAAWRRSKTLFRAGESSIKPLWLWRTRRKVRRAARIPKNCALKPARMMGGRNRGERKERAW